MRRRVLVVDDERQMVRTFRDILELRGWETGGAFSGEEAVEALEDTSYDVVLMDVRMSGMSGVDALVAMKKRRPEVRVILMTAFTAADLIERAGQEGALAVLPKPVAVPELVNRLEQAVRERNAVLVVDDDPAFLMTLGEILRNRGFETVEAGGLDEAVDRLRTRRPGIVVLDLRLDHIEPRKSIMTIREISPAVTLILYSGHPALLEETALSFRGPWIRAVLQKPFPPERLISLIEDVMDG